MEIEIRNVGIIRSAHLQFIQGLNLIVGASSSGKSTLLRAIRSMMDNSFSDSNISYGQKKLAVRMKYNGHSATYIRDLDNSNRKSAYQVDGKVYTKIGRTSLDDLSSLFKLSPVEIDGEKINFNFSAQFSGPFLLLGSASLLYSILTYRSSFDITKINDLYATDLKNVKKEIDVLVKTKSTLDKERDKKEQELQRLQSVPNIYSNVQILKNKNDILTKMRNIYTRLQQAESIKIESVRRIQILDSVLSKLKIYTGDFNKYSILYKYTSSVQSMKLSSRRSRDIFDILVRMETILSTRDLVCILSKYLQSRATYESNKNIINNIHIPNCASLQVLNDYLKGISSRDSIVHKIHDIEVTQGEVETRIREVGVCPLCKQPLCNC